MLSHSGRGKVEGECGELGLSGTPLFNNGSNLFMCSDLLQPFTPQRFYLLLLLNWKLHFEHINCRGIHSKKPRASALDKMCLSLARCHCPIPGFCCFCSPCIICLLLPSHPPPAAIESHLNFSSKCHVYSESINGCPLGRFLVPSLDFALFQFCTI